jgi:hypothetical protein
MNPRLALTLVALLTGPPAFAQAPAPQPSAPPQTVQPLELKSGKIELPLSGLVIDLPAQKKGHTYKVSSSYSLESGFDARDVIDEAVDGKLVGGTWVLVGFFTAGTCKDVVSKTELASAWESELTLHDLPFVARGGIFDFEDSLGKVPAVVICTERPKLEPGTRKALLLYHYFIGTELATSKDELVALMKKRPAVERAAKAWKLDTLAKGRPLDNPHIRVRGAPQPSTLELAVGKLTMRVPDDGTLWITRAAPDQGVDWLDRMVPALPEVSVEVIHLPESCANTLPQITGKQMKGAPTARHVPSDWKLGPILDVDGDPEYTLCRDFKGSALLVGYFLEKSFAKDLGDLRPIHALLDALTAAKL